jgi:hypothetical protein
VYPQETITDLASQLRLNNESDNLIASSIREWRKTISDAFLPVGFPFSVSEDYLAYQTFDSLQAFFSTITSLLANRALLQGLGVGDADSSATFALLLTILKDAMSRVATIVFAHRFGLTIEPECKRYRFLADLFNDSAFFLDLMSPFLGFSAKAVALCIGEALRALCGVAAGASKAALSSHFAKFDNLAELNAKEASQETAVGLCGLMVGSIVVRWVEDQRTVFWLMIVLVLVHLWMNYLGVRCVRLRTLNRQRATILFSEYLRTGRIPSVAEVAQQESIVIWRPLLKNRHGEYTAEIRFAKSYADAMAVGQAKREIFVINRKGYHTLFVWKHTRAPVVIKIMLWEGCRSEHIIQAWFHAMEIAWIMDPDAGFSPAVQRVFSINKEEELEHGGDDDSNDNGDPTGAVRTYRPRSLNRQLGLTIEAAGWDISSSSFETEAPIRLRSRSVDNDKKEQ